MDCVEWFLLDEEAVQFVCCILSWDDHAGAPNTTVPVDYTVPPLERQSTTFRLSDETRVGLEELAQWYKISLTDVIEVLVCAARRQGPLVLQAERQAPT